MEQLLDLRVGGRRVTVVLAETFFGALGGGAPTRGTLVPVPVTDADHLYMEHCLQLAREAAGRGDVPVGAIVVEDGRITGTGFNRRETDADPAAHAEIVALREACGRAGRWRVDGATLYVTLEPCPMCAGALVNARVARLVYGADDPKAGAVRSLYQICDDPRLNHRMEVEAGVHAEACGNILSDFFQKARARAKGGAP